jgi:Domain of unknown function (DUF6538)
MARDNLEQRGHKYYLRLAIPRSLRKHFLSSKGKPMAHVVEPLGDSHELAKIKAAERTAVLMRVFAAVRAGQLTTPEQVKAAVRDEIADEPPITGTIASGTASYKWQHVLRHGVMLERFLPPALSPTSSPRPGRRSARR